MRDLLSKLDALVSETSLRDPEDLLAKRKALQDLQMDPVAAEDPEIKQAIIQRKADLEKEAKAKGFSESFEVGDDFGISFSEDFEIATEIVGFVDDGIVIELDETALTHLQANGINLIDGELSESLDEARGPCWVGYKQVGMKKKGGKQVPNCVKEDEQTDESGLQYYTGVKKHGAEYMKKAAEAGREGASQAELGALKDKYSKAYKNKKDEAYDAKSDDEAGMAEAEYRGKNVPLGKKLPGDVKKSKVYVRKPNGNIVKVNFGDKKMRIKKSNPARRRSFRARHNCKNPGPRWKARYWSCRSW